MRLHLLRVKCRKSHPVPPYPIKSDQNPPGARYSAVIFFSWIDSLWFVCQPVCDRNFSNAQTASTFPSRRLMCIAFNSNFRRLQILMPHIDSNIFFQILLITLCQLFLYFAIADSPTDGLWIQTRPVSSLLLIDTISCIQQTFRPVYFSSLCAVGFLVSVYSSN